ncbi:NUMOD4 domain-containing protein [Akkermansiaceae bacterium]|nr:NUMOD4 domain-containing protein [Akkermansiaceae bacterium]
MWKDIKGYNGSYQVSDNGEVRSLDREVVTKDGRSWIAKGKLLKPWMNDKGYLLVYLPDHPKIRVHRLVAEAFLDNKENLCDINHKDEVKHNNKLENLEWCTRSYNMEYSTKKGAKSHAAKYTKEDIHKVINLYKQGFSFMEISRKTGISNTQCARYCNGCGRKDIENILEEF